MLFDDERRGLPAGRDREADRAVFRLQLDDQRAQHVDAEALPRLAIFRIARHRRRDVIVDPMTIALVVIIGPSPPRYKGADVLDFRQHRASPESSSCQNETSTFNIYFHIVELGVESWDDGERSEEGH